MRIAFVLSLSLTFNCVFSQDVERIRTGATLDKLKRNDEFYFLHPQIDTVTTTFVGTFKASAEGNKSRIENLYDVIRDEARKAGANAFKFVSFDRGEDEGALILDTFFADGTVISQSNQLSDRNIVFIFFEERPSPDHSITFKINENRRVLRGGQYYAYPIEESEQVKISKGGISSMRLSGGKNRSAAYLSLTEFGTGKVSQQVRSSGTPYNENTIYTIDRNLGALLTLVLERVE
jgi:hypothetical protein